MRDANVGLDKARECIRVRRRDDVQFQIELSLEQWGSVSAALHSKDFHLSEPDSVAMLLADQDSLFELNFVSAFIWEQLSEVTDIAQIANEVGTAFNAPKTVLSDVLALIDELRAHGLVHVEPDK